MNDPSNENYKPFPATFGQSQDLPGNDGQPLGRLS